MWASAAVTGLAIGALDPLSAVFAVVAATLTAEHGDLATRGGIVSAGAAVGALFGSYSIVCIVAVAAVHLSIRYNILPEKPEACPSPPRCYL